MTELLTLYARREPTTDSVVLSLGLKNRFDVALYRDVACTQLAARYRCDMSSKPTKRQNTVMLNCWRWRLQWV